MKYLQHVFRLCLLLTFALASQSNAQASHLAGADLTYRWLGGMDYEVTTVWYEDVAGAATLATVTSMDIEISGCGSTTVVQAPFFSVAPVLNCGAGTTYDKYTYKVNITLSGRCTNWVFLANYCCRNAIINTVGPAPGSKYICVSATLNNFDFPGNNSPTFGDDPVFFLCVCSPFVIDHNVTETDGDILSFANILPKGDDANCAAIPYTGVFSVGTPLGTALTVSPTTGIMTGTTSCTIGPLVTIMATQVTEMRSGIVIGTVSRDIQIQVANCSNNPPTLFGFAPAGPFCIGQNITYGINGSDPDGDNVTMTWGNEIADALFGVVGNGTTSPSGTFNWTPTAAGTYTFTVTVTDDGCPALSYTQTYTVEVICCDTPDLHIASCCEDDPLATCDPCIDGWRTVWIEDADGNPIGDPFGDSCWVVTWTDDQGNTYTGFSIPAYVDVAYDVNVTNTCTGCSWQESFMDSCCTAEIPDSLGCNTLKLFWDAVSGAIGYQVEITFNDPACCQGNIPPTGMRYDVTSNEFDLSILGSTPGCFSWKVRAKCSEKQYGDWSEKLCFTCGHSCTTTVPLHPHCSGGKLHWDVVAGAIGYQVNINFNDPQCCPAGPLPTGMLYNVTTNEFDLSTLGSAAGCFSWEVRARCSANTWGPWTSKICLSCTAAGGGSRGSSKQAVGNLGGGIKVFPNPASDLLHISGAEIKGGSSIQITDITGRIVKTTEIKEDGDKSISTSELSDGMYLLQLIDAKGKTLEVKKINVKH